MWKTVTDTVGVVGVGCNAVGVAHSFDVLPGCVEMRYASNILVAHQDLCLHVLHAACAEKAPLYPGISSFA
jgi:hypothetical protein